MIFFGRLGCCASARNPKCLTGGLGGPLNLPFVDLLSEAIGAGFASPSVAMPSTTSPWGKKNSPSKDYNVFVADWGVYVYYLQSTLQKGEI